MSSTPLPSLIRMSLRQLQATVRQVKAGSTEAFERLFDAAQDGNTHAQRALLKLVLHHQFAPARSSEALRVVRGLDPSDYPTPQMNTMYLSLRCLVTELHQNPFILRDITKRSIWDCIAAWIQFFLQCVVEDDPYTEVACKFQDDLFRILATFISSIMGRVNPSKGGDDASDIGIFHDILGAAARLCLFAARTNDCNILCDLAYCIGSQMGADTSAGTPARKVIVDIFSDPPNAALIIKTLYRLPVEHFVSAKKDYHVKPIFSVLRLIALLIKHPENFRAFDGLCDMALFPCLLFVLRHLFPIGGRRRYTPDDPVLSDQCVTIILAIIHHTTDQQSVYILRFLEVTDFLATLLMFAHRLQTVPPSDESHLRNWERLLLAILTNLMVSSSFYYSIGSTTRRLLCGAKMKKAEVAIGQAGGTIWDKFATLKTVMERVRARNNKFRNTRWPLCGSETCAMATEVKVIKACKLCTGCMKEYYCSRECQKADWKARHKEQCQSQSTRACSKRDQSYITWQVNLDFPLAWAEHTRPSREIAFMLGEKPAYEAVVVHLDYRIAPTLVRINEGPAGSLSHVAGVMPSEDEWEWMWCHCSCEVTFPDQHSLHGLTYDLEKGWQAHSM